MKKLIAVFLVLMILLLTSCEKAWESESEDDKPKQHLMCIPAPDGGIQTVPMWY